MTKNGSDKIASKKIVRREGGVFVEDEVDE